MSQVKFVSLILIFISMCPSILSGQVEPVPASDEVNLDNSADIRTDWNTEPPKLLWHRRIGQGTTSFAISDKRVIVGGNDGTHDIWWCIDSDYGSPFWKYAYVEVAASQLSAAGPAANAVIDEDRVIFLSKSGKVHCVGLEDGELLWKKDLSEDAGDKPPEKGYLVAPVAFDGGILVAGGHQASTLLCLSREDGNVKWQSSPQEGAICGAPIVKNEKDITTVWLTLPKRLVCLSISEKGAEEIRSLDWENHADNHTCPPLWVGDRLVLPARQSAGFATFDVDHAGFTPVYDSGTHGLKFVSYDTLEGDLVAVALGEDKCSLVRVDPTTGEVRWTEALPGKRASIVLIGEKIIILCDSGDMIAGEPKLSGFQTDAKIRVLKEPCWAPVSYADKRFYARNNLGYTLCMDIAINKPTLKVDKDTDESTKPSADGEKQ